MTEPNVVISKTERPNSFEFGPASARMKLYFETIDELKQKIKDAKELGLIDISFFPNL